MSQPEFARTIWVNGDTPPDITTAGNVWTSGSGAPVASGITAGDMYLRTSNGAVYRWNGSAWSVVANLTGPSGYSFEYDFAQDGGAVGSIPLRGTDLPQYFVVTDVSVDCKTAFTSAGSATTAFTTGQSAGDVQAVTAFDDGGNLGSSVRVIGVTVNKKMTAARTPALVVAAAALTAGKFVLHARGWQGTV
jgi:hypothetical protein